ncbi:hypothetical protein MRB53_000165 [Persea americana]|uniref:Uncharacterized protein n=1 Tax=Persea americana TaxID=3435 RepID=A0ACC2MN32_PERAE|nr:hypothetical protein MRB53_000165 [Persea americana]
MTEPSGRSWSWSDASQDLLQLILRFLTPLNHLRFGSVCRSWRIAQRECLHPPAQDLPFHIVSRDRDDTPRESIELYSFSEKKIYKKPLQRSFTDAYSVPYSRHTPSHIPEQESIGYNDYLFFSTPAHPDGLLLLKEIFSNKFLSCRLNPRSDHQYYEWQEPFIVSGWDQESCRVMSSIIFFQGKLYALNEDCGLSVVDTLFPHDFTVLKMKLERTDLAHSAPPVEWDHHAVLVESCGEMLLVFESWGALEPHCRCFSSQLN